MSQYVFEEEFKEEECALWTGTNGLLSAKTKKGSYSLKYIGKQRDMVFFRLPCLYTSEFELEIDVESVSFGSDNSSLGIMYASDKELKNVLLFKKDSLVAISVDLKDSSSIWESEHSHKPEKLKFVIKSSMSGTEVILNKHSLGTFSASYPKGLYAGLMLNGPSEVILNRVALNVTGNFKYPIPVRMLVNHVDKDPGSGKFTHLRSFTGGTRLDVYPVNEVQFVNNFSMYVRIREKEQKMSHADRAKVPHNKKHGCGLIWGYKDDENYNFIALKGAGYHGSGGIFHADFSFAEIGEVREGEEKVILKVNEIAKEEDEPEIILNFNKGQCSARTIDGKELGTWKEEEMPGYSFGFGAWDDFVAVLHDVYIYTDPVGDFRIKELITEPMAIEQSYTPLPEFNPASANWVYEASISREQDGQVNNGFGTYLQFNDGSYLMLMISATGFFKVRKYVDKKWVDVTDWKTSFNVIKSWNKNLLAIAKNGSDYYLFINGILIFKERITGKTVSVAGVCKRDEMKVKLESAIQRFF